MIISEVQEKELHLNTRVTPHTLYLQCLLIPCFAFYSAFLHLLFLHFSVSPSLSLCLSVQFPLVVFFVFVSKETTRTPLSTVFPTCLQPIYCQINWQPSYQNSFISFTRLFSCSQNDITLFFSIHKCMKHATNICYLHISLNAHIAIASAKWIWFVTGVSWCESDCTTKLIM